MNLISILVALTSITTYANESIFEKSMMVASHQTCNELRFLTPTRDQENFRWMGILNDPNVDGREVEPVNVRLMHEDSPYNMLRIWNFGTGEGNGFSWFNLNLENEHHYPGPVRVFEIGLQKKPFTEKRDVIGGANIYVDDSKYQKAKLGGHRTPLVAALFYVETLDKEVSEYTGATDCARIDKIEPQSMNHGQCYFYFAPQNPGENFKPYCW